MKSYSRLFILVGGIIFSAGCGSAKKAPSGTGIEPGNVIIPKADAKSFHKELAGTWNVVSMRRQQKAELEMLSGVTLQFDTSDSKFSGKAPCNRIFGNIQLNGYSIRFRNIGATKMACDRLEQETAFLNLLETRISTFTIEGDTLYLRDGISNVVFSCEREQ